MNDKAYAKRILNNYMNPQNGSDEAAEIEDAVDSIVAAAREDIDPDIYRIAEATFQLSLTLQSIYRQISAGISEGESELFKNMIEVNRSMGEVMKKHTLKGTRNE